MNSIDNVLGEVIRCEKTLCLNYAGKVRTAAEGRLSINVCKGCYTRSKVTRLKLYVRDCLKAGVSKIELRLVVLDELLKLIPGTHFNNLHIIVVLEYYGLNS